MFIQTEATPNPKTLKFLPGQVLLETGTVDCPTREAAEHAPLAKSLFAIDGVDAVFIGYDFVTVTSDKDWEDLKNPVLNQLMAHLQSGGAIAHQPKTNTEIFDAEDTEIVVQIKELLDTRVRPAVAQDGGDIVFHGFQNGVVSLHMQGACAGCPSSSLTLKMGIENLLRHYIPEVGEVRSVIA